MTQEQGEQTLVGQASDSTVPIYIVDDESSVRRSVSFLLKVAGYVPRPFLSGDDFLAEAADLKPGIVLLDIRMPGMDGLEVLEALGPRGDHLSVIVMTGHGDISSAVKSLRLGAIDFLEKPFEDDVLFKAIELGIAKRQESEERVAMRRDATARIEALSKRERDVLNLLAEGKSNKEVAHLLDLSVRTVEMHRAAMFDRLGVQSLAEALRIGFAGGLYDQRP